MRELLAVSVAVMAAICIGCTSFRVHQVDDSNGERTITSDIRAVSWFSGSQAGNLKALQTDKTQSLGVDQLRQQGPTNTAEVINAATEFLRTALGAGLK